jgi:hypothetical protein
MGSELLTEGIWKHLSQSIRKSQRNVLAAIAYFGRDAHKILPLKAGSTLIVNASEGAVAAGQTYPADLLTLQSKGVKIYSVNNLHAKMLVIGNKAFIGSANASTNSKNNLLEATLVTTDRNAVRSARTYILGLRGEPLGPERLKELSKLYKPPQFQSKTNQKRRKKSKGRAKAEYSDFKILQLVYGDYPEGSEDTYKQGAKEAKAKMQRKSGFELEDFRWSKQSFKKGLVIMQIVKDDKNKKFCHAPGSVIHTKNWSNGRQSCTFVYLEVPKKKRKALSRIKYKLPPKMRKRLNRTSMASHELADKLRAIWAT